MVKKIYSKMTKERQEKFQIETCVYLNNNQKYVEKRALTPEAVKHVNNMYVNYNRYCDWGIDLLASCELTGETGCVRTKYISGTSLCEEMLKAADNDNREKFIELLLLYKGLIMRSIEGRSDNFSYTEEFVEIFGKYDDLVCSKAAPYMNIDMAFDNIIQDVDGKYKVIDHEWIFSFPIPVNFVFFRAIYAFYIRYHNELCQFISLDSIYDIFGISDREIKIYQEMDASFVDYVYGKENGYNNILKTYQKENYTITDIVKEPIHYAQLYIDYGEGFTEEDSEYVTLEHNSGEYELCFKIDGEVEAFRFDPMDVAGSVMIKEVISINQNQEINPLRYQSINKDFNMEDKDVYFFDDPQYSINVVQGEKIKYLIVKAEIILFDEKTYLLMEAVKQYRVFAQAKELAAKEYKIALEDYKAWVEEYKTSVEEYKNEKDIQVSNLLAEKSEIENQLNELKSKRFWIKLRA